jgi:hypothetical protein
MQPHSSNPLSDGLLRPFDTPFAKLKNKKQEHHTCGMIEAIVHLKLSFCHKKSPEKGICAIIRQII